MTSAEGVLSLTSLNCERPKAGACHQQQRCLSYQGWEESKASGDGPKETMVSCSIWALLIKLWAFFEVWISKWAWGFYQHATDGKGRSQKILLQFTKNVKNSHMSTCSNKLRHKRWRGKRETIDKTWQLFWIDALIFLIEPSKKMVPETFKHWAYGVTRWQYAYYRVWRLSELLVHTLPWARSPLPSSLLLCNVKID